VNNELVRVPPSRVHAIVVETKLPEPVERAGSAARFAWEEFFFVEHHNPRTGTCRPATVDGVVW
jgi:integrase/recombinase XerD